MRIHIPAHLEKLEIVSQLKQLIQAYSLSDITEDTLDNFQEYLYSNSLDPVKRFLMICISEDSLDPDIDYENLIDYYTAKFFSFRGTMKIFDFLDEIKGILGISVIDYTYTIDTLTVNFGEVVTSDMNLFTSSVTQFFQSLLYYRDYIDTIETLRLELTAKTKITISDGIYTFLEHKIEEVYEE